MNKDFNTLEKVMCNMADSFYQPVEFPFYAEKLDKEHAELQAELNHKDFTNALELMNMGLCLTDEMEKLFIERRKLVKDELADVFCFVLRISNSLHISGTELLQHAMSKMVRRIGDENYNRV